MVGPKLVDVFGRFVRPASIPIRVIETTRFRLAGARSTGTTIPSPKEISLAEGYEISAEIERERTAAGCRRVGWKLGFTSLRAGDIVTTGSMIGATPVAAGQRWTNRLDGPASSSVEITFT